jgi:hypothetical protein
LQAQTSIPLQKRYRQAIGHYVVEQTLNEWCDGSYVDYEREDYYPIIATGAELDGFPSTNWAQEVRLRIKDLSVNLGTSLVEYRETADMFQEFARGVRNAYRSYRKIRKGRLAYDLCSVASAHLTNTYGVTPLAQTLADGIGRLNNRLERDITRRVVVTSRDSDSFRFDRDNGVEYNCRRTKSQRAIVYVKLKPQNVVHGLSLNDFTLGNAPELLWEKVPFSFVVDWGTDVGSYLSALDALKDVESLFGTLTTKRRYSHKSIRGPGGARITHPEIMKYHDHEREVITTIPMPRLPTFSPSKSYRRIANGLSLLVGINKRCKPSQRWYRSL